MSKLQRWGGRQEREESIVATRREPPAGCRPSLERLG